MVREELYPMWMVSQVGKLILELEMISCQKEQSPLHIHLLINQIEKLSPLLQKLCGRSWSDLAAQSAFSALYGALEGTFRVADKWRTCELRLILLSDVFGDMFIEEIGEKLNEAQECLQKVKNDKEMDNILKSLEEFNGLLTDKSKPEKHRVALTSKVQQKLDPVMECLLNWLAINSDWKEMKSGLPKKIADEIEKFEAEKLQRGRIPHLAPLPQEVICKICKKVMDDPVLIGSGYTYCRRCISGRTSCPQSNVHFSNPVANLALKGVIAWWRKMSASTSNSETGSRRLQIPRGLAVLDLVPGLGSDKPPLVLLTLNRLHYIVTNSHWPHWQHEVLEAEVVPELSRLLQSNDETIAKPAVKVMEALTAESRDDNKNDDFFEICTLVQESRERLIQLMEEGGLETRLLAAKTMANILVIKEIRDIIFGNQKGIVHAFFTFWNISYGDASYVQDVKQTCIKGLTRLASCSTDATDAESTETIAKTLLCLAKGDPKSHLVEDALVALEQLLASGVHNGIISKTLQQCHRDMKFLVRALPQLPRIDGRKATINILWQLMAQEQQRSMHEVELLVEKDLVSALFKVIGEVRHNDREEEAELLSCSIKLLGVCLSHPSSTAVLPSTSIKILVEILHQEGQISEALSRDILALLETLVLRSDQHETAIYEAGGAATLLKLAGSKIVACREKIAQKLQENGVMGTEISGAVDVLKGLLLDPESTKCQRDAVVALEALAFTSENPVLVTDSLHVDEVLTFIGAQWDPDCRRAAVGLLSLVAKDNPQIALRSVKLIADLLQCRDAIAARRAADVLLNFAGANSQVRLQIAIAKVNVLHALLNLQPSDMEYREKLISTLILFCQSEGDKYSQSPMQRAVIDASGHEILLQCLEEETLKPLAAKGLAELLKTKENQPALMKAEFVKIALNQIVSSRFYDVNVALALRTLSESSEGCTCMKNDPHSSQALLLLLEHCPDPEGKKAAAVVINRLFSELEDRTEIIANCGLLINLVGEQYKEVLEALEVVTRESSGKLSAYKQKVLDFLVPLLQSNSDISIQDLVLLILANLSCDIITDSTDTEKQSIRWAIVNSDIPGILYEMANTLSSKGLRNMIVIIRNISLAGSDACKKLLEDDGAAHFLITKLLRVHLQQEMEFTDVITYSVIALEKFAEDDHGKTVIVTNKGVDVLVDILQRIPVKPAKPARAKVYATKILVMLADDESLQKAVCKALFEAKPLAGLMDILKSTYEDACKGRAATLIKYLVMHGPPHALTSIVQAGFIEVLCENLPVAKDALDHICSKNKEADNRRKKLQRSQSSGLKLSRPSG